MVTKLKPERHYLIVLKIVAGSGFDFIPSQSTLEWNKRAMGPTDLIKTFRVTCSHLLDLFFGGGQVKARRIVWLWFNYANCFLLVLYFTLYQIS